ncbi:MAG: endoribonuclease MazF [Candidatus Omnitrophica bacterium]|nr:endoribonuclease MazF [Candidatus Omnitrophota bacterium]
MARYVPDQGDLVWVSFNPQAGHEQAGLRPALVVSPGVYNSKAGLALMCPITSQVKGYPFEVQLPLTSSVRGVVLSDQIKSLDWHARKTKFIERLPAVVTREVLAKVEAILKG